MRTSRKASNRTSSPASAPARFALAVELVRGSAATFRRTARRYSICADDAEDAYQRGLEILITKAPSIPPDELRPWLQTVIKHEALAIRAQRERLFKTPHAQSEAPGPEEQFPSRERVRHAAEALGHLKHSEAQCMLLKALGYSYEEISDRTGYSWTKVNRCLSEGRKRFFERFGEIDSGVACERLRPAVEAAARGEARPEQLREVQAHVASCAQCRAAIRLKGDAKAQLEALSPIALLATLKGTWWSRVQEGLVGALGDRLASVAAKAHQLAELVTPQKTAVAVASSAALAGGVAVEHGAVDPGKRGHADSPAGRLVAAEAAKPPAPQGTVSEPRNEEDAAAPVGAKRDREATRASHTPAEPAEREFEPSGTNPVGVRRRQFEVAPPSAPKVTTAGGKPLSSSAEKEDGAKEFAP